MVLFCSLTNLEKPCLFHADKNVFEIFSFAIMSNIIGGVTWIFHWTSDLFPLASPLSFQIWRATTEFEIEMGLIAFGRQSNLWYLK